MHLCARMFLRFGFVLFSLTTLGALLAQEPPAAPSGSSNTATVQRALTYSEVREKYENCPSGWYSGPRPGKSRFVRDPFIWAVSPAFAQRFCMPPEFVSTDLKGAEAVAFRVLNKSDDENCGYGGNAAVCAPELVLRFEVYVGSDVKLPKAHEGRYFHRPYLPSSGLIGLNRQREDKARLALVQKFPEAALKPHFDGQQVGIEGVKDGKVAWPVVALFEQTHFGGIYEGIDYYAFEGSTSFFENPGIKQNNVTRFALTFLRRGYKFKGPSSKGALLSEYEHVIELPEVFSDKVAEADRTKGRNWADLARRAFAPVPSASVPAK